MEYCPYCITKLEKSLKKLGDCTEWFVCRVCGFRCESKDVNWHMSPYIINEINKKKIVATNDLMCYTNINIMLAYEKFN